MKLRKIRSIFHQLNQASKIIEAQRLKLTKDRQEIINERMKLLANYRFINQPN